MNWIIGFLLVMAVAGIGQQINSGLEYLGDSIKIANGYIYECQDKQHWYDIAHCEWVKKAQEE